MQIENAGGVPTGLISKKFRGFLEEMFTDSDTFQIEFPTNIDVATKALFIGATMLIVMYSFY